MNEYNCVVYANTQLIIACYMFDKNAETENEGALEQPSIEQLHVIEHPRHFQHLFASLVRCVTCMFFSLCVIFWFM